MGSLHVSHDRTQYQLLLLFVYSVKDGELSFSQMQIKRNFNEQRQDSIIKISYYRIPVSFLFTTTYLNKSFEY